MFISTPLFFSSVNQDFFIADPTAVTQDFSTAAVCSRGCAHCKLIGQVYADGSETVTGSIIP